KGGGEGEQVVGGRRGGGRQGVGRHHRWQRRRPAKAGTVGGGAGGAGGQGVAGAGSHGQDRSCRGGSEVVRRRVHMVRTRRGTVRRRPGRGSPARRCTREPAWPAGGGTRPRRWPARPAPGWR